MRSNTEKRIRRFVSYNRWANWRLWRFLW